MTLELKNDLTEIATLADGLERFADRNDIGSEVLSLLNLALEEVVTNIISYGFPSGGDHRIRIELAVDDRNVTARVQDDGVAFEPLRKTDPDLDVPPEEHHIGELGIRLVKSLMDEVRYSREDTHNVLFIRKALKH